ncbi:hypothetical protein D8B26_006529 [Coccidioides posadasii str. Silveira]|uniref:Uncharacterized protein n=3 Tax=Coccidioides posadasii TaxID=199306 RepID=E9CTP1_COCPS|nr:F-box domain containing protein [Coccidioides posadasii C735 delta SOWgp]EER27412.1 F-box domain containing protein [Coccidioides posadasii C735 delta SOWgp]EFW22981.1 conserved hypothetical protein [Coccidioides posadasii str. Silveira]KMM67228.1 hypothetical protein CPAG_03563 [Coccidioides posadasii RMSCC 3488]QVM11887.1 hypothetical protein D8B26_006529 [Coccidioides posadasii str. Silveira]|eukprot:XP_003069557.1 F-box domain containing protein [Coccidioides posadasii C735 delta SOWgp]
MNTADMPVMSRFSLLDQRRLFLELAEQCLVSLRDTNNAKSTQPHLLGLPLELLWEVTRHLPPASAKMLAYTCHKFYHLSYTWLKNIEFFPVERFETLCLLERDQIIRTFACRGCLTDHPETMFPPDELRQQPFLRWCVSTIPIFPLCPNHSLSFRDAQQTNKMLRQSLPYSNHGWTSREACCFPRDTGSGVVIDHHFVVSRDRPGMGILTIVNICDVMEGEGLPDRNHIEECLASHSDIRICPHLPLNDPRITDIYNRDVLDCKDAEPRNYNRSAELFQDAEAREVVYCEEENCESFTHWYYGQGYPYQDEGNGSLQLLAFRHLGVLEDPWDPSWLAHTPLTGCNQERGGLMEE